MSGRDAVSDDLLTNLNAEQRQIVDDYLGAFLFPDFDENGQKCTDCGAYITGTLGLANFSGVHYPGARGEGECYDCGKRFRHMHRISGLVPGQDFVVRDVPLMYKSNIILLR